mgnify:CR=1 FL=1
MRKHRALYRRQRTQHGIPLVALIGYTNSGKSTLLNSLSNADVFVEDKLFATLDPTTRRITIPGIGEVLITDTVGFIQKLPHAVIAAFGATLEELEEAALLLHVIDITHQNAVDQCVTVDKVLAELNLEAKPRVAVLNKLDLLAPSEEDIGNLPREIEVEEPVLISAAKGWGFNKLREKIAQKLAGSGSHNTGYVT